MRLSTLVTRSALCAFTTLVCASGALAATITYETRGITSAVDKGDYLGSWGSQNSSVNSQAIDTVDGTRPGANSFVRLTLNFDVGNAGSDWSFQLAPDATYGGAIYLDGQLMSSNGSDLWWGGKWGNTGELLSVSAMNLASGSHTLEAFWAEKCCSGAQAGRFSTDGNAWQALTTENLESASVPIPAAFWLFGSALAALGFTLRRK